MPLSALSVSLNMETGKALIAGGPRADATTRPMFPQSSACYNVIDGRNRKMEIDTEMDTEIEILMEIDTEIDTETEIDIISYGDIAAANVATSVSYTHLTLPTKA